MKSFSPKRDGSADGNGTHYWVQPFILFCIGGVLLLASPKAEALIVDLDAYVDLAILSSDGVNPIADGSWVFIIGSFDNTIDPMVTWGGTNYIAASVTGDDVILGAIQIPFNTASNSGTFFASLTYESDDINFVYIRFFDTIGPLTGLLWWGTSSMFQLGITLGVSTVRFDQFDQLAVSNQNNFVVIPEPNTMHLFVLIAGMVGAIRVRNRMNAAAATRSGPDDTSSAQV